MSFRRATLLALSVIGALALAAAISLSLVTERLSSTAAALALHIETVRAAQQVEVDLLIHSRAQDPLTRTMLQADLLEGLRIVRQFVSSPEEGAAVDSADQTVSRYILAVETSGAPGDRFPELSQALGAVRRVADQNIAQARETEANADRWNRLADRLSLAIALVIVIGVPLTMSWVAFFAFRPMFGLLGAMKAFASGDMHARAAPTRGVEELRTVGEQFNAMADAIARQRQNQLSFLAGVSHDMRTPINALTMSVAVLEHESAHPADRTMRETLGIIKRQIGFLNRMVEDLHDAQQIDAGQFTLRMEECDARALVEAVCELFRSVSEAHHLRVSAPQEPVPVRCDPVRLGQVLNNLVSNAIKYSPKGGEISVAIHRAGKEIVFEVTDAGIGIPHDELAHVFEPFRRTRLSKQEIPGTGLGLHVSKRIVEAHQGRMDLESRPGSGTTVRVHLPAPVDDGRRA